MAESKRMSRDEFKRAIVEIAHQVCEPAGFPWQLAAAQACHESAYGQYVPVDTRTRSYSFNIFGVKGRGPAGQVLCLTTEYYPADVAARMCASGRAEMTNETVKGKAKVRVRDYFRAYHDFAESLQDYLKLMRTPRYARVWEHKSDPAAAARAVQACGYATDPKYSDKLITLMRREGWIA